jgi:flagellar biosynthesis repressor protein FlbT
MPLKIKMKPDEEIIVNGCVIKNGSKGAMLSIENYADVIRGKDILQQEEATTPIREVYYLIQSALIYSKAREQIVPHIQQRLADLVHVVSGSNQGLIFEAANNVSAMQYYKALTCIRSIMREEDRSR